MADGQDPRNSKPDPARERTSQLPVRATSTPQVTPANRRDRFATLGLYLILTFLLVWLAWTGEAGPFWGQVDAAGSPLYRERLEQAIQEMGR